MARQARYADAGGSALGFLFSTDLGIGLTALAGPPVLACPPALRIQLPGGVLDHSLPLVVALYSDACRLAGSRLARQALVRPDMVVVQALVNLGDPCESLFKKRAGLD